MAVNFFLALNLIFSLRSTLILLYLCKILEMVIGESIILIVNAILILFQIS